MTDIIQQFAKNGRLVHEWEGYKAPAEYYGISPGCISKCCKDRIPEYHGFVWKVKTI